MRGGCFRDENHSNLTSPGTGWPTKSPSFPRRYHYLQDHVGAAKILRSDGFPEEASGGGFHRSLLLLARGKHTTMNQTLEQSGELWKASKRWYRKKDRFDICLCLEMFPNSWVSWSISRSVDLPLVWFGRGGSRVVPESPRRGRRTTAKRCFETWTGGDDLKDETSVAL